MICLYLDFLDAFEDNKAAEQVSVALKTCVKQLSLLHVCTLQERIHDLEANVVAILEHISQVQKQLIRSFSNTDSGILRVWYSLNKCQQQENLKKCRYAHVLMIISRGELLSQLSSTAYSWTIAYACVCTCSIVLHASTMQVYVFLSGSCMCFLMPIMVLVCHSQLANCLLMFESYGIPALGQEQNYSSSNNCNQFMPSNVRILCI